MKKYGKVLGLVLLSALAILGCSKQTPMEPSMKPDQGTMCFSLSAEDNIASGTVTITKNKLQYTQPIEIQNSTGTVSFFNIQVGTWHIQVSLFDAEGVEIYFGSNDALVKKDLTTTVNIQAVANTGNLVINVTLPTTTPTATPTPDTIYRIAFAKDMGGYSSEIFAINTDGTDLVQLTSGLPNGWTDEPRSYRGGSELLFYDCNTSDRSFMWKMNYDGSNQRQFTNVEHVYSPNWSFDGTKISGFIYYKNDVFVMNADGSDYRVIFNANNGTNTCWTPDGRVVCSHCLDYSQWAICIMNNDGSNLKTITPYYNDIAGPVDCSLDSKILCSLPGSNGKKQIFVMTTEGTNMQQLTSESEDCWDAKYNFDCSKIAYSTSSKIYFMNADGSDKMYVTEGNDPCFLY